ncbi:DUF1349 domain-containing protein [Chloroflexi bacterium TSY]|nr:DUF1349 domain-containing protein [Chloroflexi bacterium TSY]
MLPLPGVCARPVDGQSDNVTHFLDRLIFLKALHFGRGQLPSERIFLRLERIDRYLNEFCSADGEQWYDVGSANFTVEEPLLVGVHAIGNIERMIYHGAYSEGMAISFESFRLLRQRKD